MTNHVGAIACAIMTTLFSAGCNDSGSSHAAAQPASQPAPPKAASAPAAQPTATPAQPTPAQSTQAQPGQAQPKNGDTPTVNQPTDKSAASQASGTPKLEKALFGAGCFWGVEYIFEKQVPGVVSAVSGYAGGKTANPTYQDVCSHESGHAEVVQVTFDPAKVSYEKLVDAFFRLHDPTQVNRQGPDIGDQYRSVIFFYSPEQKATAEAVKTRRASKYARPIATTIEAAPEFYKAEDYHQQYYERKGGEPYCHVLSPE